MIQQDFEYCLPKNANPDLVPPGFTWDNTNHGWFGDQFVPGYNPERFIINASKMVRVPVMCATLKVDPKTGRILKLWGFDSYEPINRVFRENVLWRMVPFTSRDIHPTYEFFLPDVVYTQVPFGSLRA